MPQRNLILNFSMSGQNSVKSTINGIKGQAADLGKSSVSVKIGADDTDWLKKAGDVLAQSQEMGRSKTVIKIAADATDADAKMEQLRLAADALGMKKVNIGVSVNGDKAMLTLTSLKSATALTSGGGSAGSVGGSAASSAGEAGAASPSLLGVGAGLGAILLPALLPVVLGVGTALGGVLAASMVNKGFAATLSKQLPLFQSILNTATQPVARAFTAMLPSIDKFAKALGPDLKAAFSASVPFLSMFVNLVEVAAKTLLPAFTTSMKQITPYIPQLTAAFTQLLVGVAQFITLLGPSMAASVTIFVGLMKGLQVALNVLGVAVNLLTQLFHLDFQLMEDTVKFFAGLFSGNLGASSRAAEAFGHDVEAAFNTMKDVINTALKNIGLAAFDHAVASTFDDVRHTIASAMDSMVASVHNSFNSILSFARSWPSLLLRAIGNLGGLLVGEGRNLIAGLFSGITGALANVGGWVKANIFNPIVGAIKSLFGIHSPSTVMAELGGHLVTGLIQGLITKDPTQFITKVFGSLPNALGSLVGKGLVDIEKLPGKALSALGKVGGAIGGFFARLVGGGGSGVSQWMGVVLQALSLNGLPASLAAQVLRQISSESGGNPNAINLTDSNAAAGDPSRGLLQTIGSTFSAYHIAGTSSNIYDPLANVAAAINYARHVYGPSLMSGGNGLGSGHGYAFGGRTTKGFALVGEHGPEIVGFGGNEYVTPNSRLGGKGAGGNVYHTHVHFNGMPLVNKAEIGRAVNEASALAKRRGNQ